MQIKSFFPAEIQPDLTSFRVKLIFHFVVSSCFRDLNFHLQSILANAYLHRVFKKCIKMI